MAISGTSTPPGESSSVSGAAARIGTLLKPWNVRRVLLVSDRMLEQVGVVEQVLRPLADAGLDIVSFLDGEPEPSYATADKAVEFARSKSPEAVIGLGGGSNIDLAKIVAAALPDGGWFEEFAGYDSFRSRCCRWRVCRRRREPAARCRTPRSSPTRQTR